MISIVVNGEIRPFDQKPSGRELLARLGLSEAPLVVELNGTVISRQDFLERQLVDNDNIELVTIVGGG